MKFYTYVKIFSFSVLFLIRLAYAGDYTQFDRVWPNIAQPWYFDAVGGVVYEKSTNTFIVMDKTSGLISRVTFDGYVLNRWGGKSESTIDGKFRLQANGLSYKGMFINMDIDNDGNIYVTDPFNCRLQYFSSSGTFIKSLSFTNPIIDDFDSFIDSCTVETISTNSSHFIPLSVAISKYGVLAVLFTNRIELYINNEKFSEIPLSEEFSDIKFLNNSNDFYLASIKSIRKYSYVDYSYKSWSTPYYKENNADAITNIDVDESDNLIFSIPFSGTFHIYNRLGQSLSEKKYFLSNSEISEEMNLSKSIANLRQIAAFVKNNQLFIFDQVNDFIKKINLDDSSSTEWGGARLEIYSAIGYPKRMFKDEKSNDFIFITNKSISRFDQRFTLLKSVNLFNQNNQCVILASFYGFGDKAWLVIKDEKTNNSYIAVVYLNDMSYEVVASLESGLQGRNDIYIASDQFDNVYLTTSEPFQSGGKGYNRLYKFIKAENKFISIEIDISNSDGNQVISAYDNIVAISVATNKTHIYLRDSFNHQVFGYIWDDNGLNSDSQLNSHVYIAEKIFLSSGKLMLVDKNFDLFSYEDDSLKKIVNLGSSGVGYMNYSDLTNLQIYDGKIYITEAINKRLQILQLKTIPDRSKAVLVVGGDESGNALWDESQANANHAFWVLANQGYTKENIQYLNRNTQLDLDGNGKPDDVDGLPTRANLKAALTEWAKDGEDVVLYMIGHGGAGTFQLGGGEVLQASELNQWLTELQAVMPGKVTVIYDACESGSFQPLLTNSTYPRTVITSTRAGENAYFQDAISFSHLFWNQVFRVNL
ncbi:MAG: hypothetical protein IPL34_18375 [Thiofilum sp.]|uniref:C13 family peptidase n=1 Tax=Thiofilum sp. TaxID=2212733 RepID=UPI0025F1184B|nr:C13 family peptidase [Thiofilum sp.]MBK8455259.1 hypothetical protein [Thiofilum sp.]